MNAPTSSPAAPRAPATTTTAIATTTSSAPSQTAPPPPVPAPPPPTPPSHRHRYHLHHGNPSSSTMNKSVTRDLPHDIHDMDHPNDNNTNNAIANRARRLRSRYLNSQNIRLSRSSSSSSTAAATNNMGPYLSAIASDPSPSPRLPHPSNISSFRHSGHPHSLYRHPTPPLPSSSTSLINSVNSPSQQQQQQLQLQLQLQRRASLRPTASFSSSSLSTAQHPMHPNHQRIQLSSSSSYSSATALQQQHRQQHRHRQRQQQSSRIDTNNNNNSMSNTSTTPYTSSSVHKFILDREIGIHQGSNKIMKKSRMNPIPTLNLPTMSPKLLSWIESEMIDRLDLGTYIELDKPSNHVRSTISIAFSHDGSLFASTHGDHTVKVFEYPSGKQITCLDGHPRTPWTVRFHPKNKFILASGCLGSDCRIWDLKLQKCIRKHTFRSSISCVSFNPNGDVLAVTSGKQLLLWDYLNDRRDGNRNPGDDWMDGQASGHALAQQRSSRHYSNSSSRSSSSSSNSNNAGLQHVGKPRDILTRSNPFHMVDFHPSGTMLMTGEKNRFPSSSAATTSNANANNNNNAATGAATANIPTNAGTTNTAVVTNTEVQTNGNNQNNNEPNQNIDNQNNTNQQQQQLHASANVPNNNNNNTNNHQNQNNNNNNTNNHQNQNNNNNNTTQAALAAAAAAAEEQQFTLCLVIHRLDRRLQRTYTDPVLTVPRAVAYNDAGIHFSPCGTMLAACIPIDNSNHFRIAVLSLTNRDDGIKIGDVLYETRLDRGHVTALTNLKFSATGKHLLAGFSFRPTNPVLRAQIQIQINNSGEGNNTRRRPTAGGRRNNNIIRRRERNNSHSHHQLAHHHDIHQHFGGVQNIKKQVRVVDIYRLEGEGHLKRVKSLCADFDMQQTNNNNSNNSNNNNNHNNNNSDDNHANNNEETTNNSSPDNDNSNDNNQNNNTNWEGGVEDEINVAVFGGGGGVADGVVYGTQKGRIRMFQMKTGRVADLLEEGEDYTKRAELEDEDDCLDIDLEERGAINSVDEDIDIDEDIDSDDDIIGEDDDEEDDDEDDNEFSTMEVVSDVLGPAPSAHENFAAYRHRARPSNSE